MKARRIAVLGAAFLAGLYLVSDGDLLAALGLGVYLIVTGYLSHRFPDPEFVPDDRWVHTDLSQVPYVIARAEPRGHLLPWYRRVFGKRLIEELPPRVTLTYRD